MVVASDRIIARSVKGCDRACAAAGLVRAAVAWAVLSGRLRHCIGQAKCAAKGDKQSRLRMDEQPYWAGPYRTCRQSPLVKWCIGWATKGKIGFPPNLSGPVTDDPRRPAIHRVRGAITIFGAVFKRRPKLRLIRPQKHHGFYLMA